MAWLRNGFETDFAFSKDLKAGLDLFDSKRDHASTRTFGIAITIDSPFRN